MLNCKSRVRLVCADVMGSSLELDWRVLMLWVVP